MHEHDLKFLATEFLLKLMPISLYSFLPTTIKWNSLPACYNVVQSET